MKRTPEFGATQRTEMAHRIDAAARKLRSLIPAEHDGEGERLINLILDDLALLDSKRAKRDAVPKIIADLKRDIGLDLKPLNK